jgi:hypothetical protein
MFAMLLNTNPLSAEVSVLIFVVAVAGLALALLWLGQLPGAMARRSGNPQWSTIRLLGWIGLVIWPLWVLAMVWASRSHRAVLMPELMVPVTCPRRDERRSSAARRPTYLSKKSRHVPHPAT